MTPQLPALDVDVVVEHAGHEVTVRGSNRDFVAEFSTFSSMAHFLRAALPFRKAIPDGYSFQVVCRGFRLPRV